MAIAWRWLSWNSDSQLLCSKALCVREVGGDARTRRRKGI